MALERWLSLLITVLAEDKGSIPSTHMATHNILTLVLLKDLTTLLLSEGGGRGGAYTYTDMQAKPSYE